jgi:putative FmdB family regulatory protein
MPTYEYVCSKCGHEFEKYQPISQNALKTCPKELCGQKKWGKGKVKRAIGTGGGLLFKGSGFYITDYRSEGYKSEAKKDYAPATAGLAKPAATPATPASSESASSSSATPAPAKSESKPAVKAGKKE